MSKSYFFPFGMLLLLSITFMNQSCLKDSCEATRTYVLMQPVYKKVNEIRTDIRMEGPRELKAPGKIYFYNNFIFINEYREGVHIVNNSDPSNPQIVGFVAIPGNVDMAVSGNLMYADNYIDLLTIDISNPQAPQLVSRTENVFNSLALDVDLGHLVYYEPTDVTQAISCDNPNFQLDFFDCPNCSTLGGIRPGRPVFFSAESVNKFSSSFDNSSSAGRATTGIGGSLARFTLAQERLYTVSEFDLNVFSLKDPTAPVKSNTVNIGWGIETIFPYEDKLFIGSRSGMFIFDNSNPDAPQQLSVFQHANACDPVFVDGNTAYVTLRDGTECETFTNQLEVVDVTDLTRPSLIKIYPMHHPIGLSVHNNTLYLCEDDQGLKVFDVTDKLAISDRLLEHRKGFTTYDIIVVPYENPLALVIGKDGLYQFDVSNPDQLRELSKLPVYRE